jgi:hypothetical protein
VPPYWAVTEMVYVMVCVPSVPHVYEHVLHALHAPTQFTGKKKSFWKNQRSNLTWTRHSGRARLIHRVTRKVRTCRAPARRDRRDRVDRRLCSIVARCCATAPCTPRAHAGHGCKFHYQKSIISSIRYLVPDRRTSFEGVRLRW